MRRITHLRFRHAVLAVLAVGVSWAMGADLASDGLTGTVWIGAFDAADADGSGSISAEELAAAQQWAELILNTDFDLADANGDEMLRRSELSRYASRLWACGVGEADSDADSDLAEALSLEVLLSALGARDEYRSEVDDLLAALADVGDDEVDRVTYVVNHPQDYPRIAPLVTRWAWRHPGRRRLLPRAVVPRRPHAKAEAHPPPPRGHGRPPKPPSAQGPPKKGPKPGGPPRPPFRWR